MKNSMFALIGLLLMILVNQTFSQNITITDDENYSAESSAMLDVKSTTKGMLVPRLSATDRQNIASPVTGLLVFDTSH